MKELKKIGVLSVGRVFGVFGLIVSALQMIVLKIISINPTFASQYGINATQFTFGFVALTIFSATVAYFISGLVVALIYNLVAKRLGGIELDLDVAKKVIKKKK